MLTQVLHVEQQVVKSRVKRDFTLPSDPLWSAQWYLVSSMLHCVLIILLSTEQQFTRQQVKQRHECSVGVGAGSDRERSRSDYSR